MSPEHESSYYEIALTNRQVLTIFVVLLTCLVAAFLSGVWIGRRDGAEGPLVAAVGEPPAEAAMARMTELNFFTDGEPGDRGGKAGPPPAPATRPESPPAGPPPAAKAPPEKTPPEKAPPEKAPPEKAPAEKAPAARPPAPPPPKAAPGATPGRVIQVFSTLDAGQADKLVRRLGDGGFPAYLVEESLRGQTTYRVRVGPYQQEAKARQIAEQLRREYRLETWITSQAG